MSSSNPVRFDSVRFGFTNTGPGAPLNQLQQHHSSGGEQTGGSNHAGEVEDAMAATIRAKKKRNQGTLDGARFVSERKETAVQA